LGRESNTLNDSKDEGGSKQVPERKESRPTKNAECASNQDLNYLNNYQELASLKMITQGT
jgi:hypothetical protein